MTENILICSIVFFSSVCQSLTGVGLVMIGIPMLIISGISFEHALSICLPGSLIINSAQLIPQFKKISKNDYFSYLTMSCVYLSFLFYAYSTGITFEKLTAGCVLTLAGLFGFRSSLREPLLNTLNVKPRITDVIIGIVHAVSSMGGTVLSLTGAARYKDSNASRRFIAGGYLSLGIIQLFFYLSHGMRFSLTIYSVIPIPVYIICNKFISPNINHSKLKSIIFTITLIYGALLIRQSMN